MLSQSGGLGCRCAPIQMKVIPTRSVPVATTFTDVVPPPCRCHCDVLASHSRSPGLLSPGESLIRIQFGYGGVHDVFPSLGASLWRHGLEVLCFVPMMLAAVLVCFSGAQCTLLLASPRQWLSWCFLSPAIHLLTPLGLQGLLVRQQG